MLPYERLTEVFERALSNGLESLSEKERGFYLIQLFILEHEMNGLSGYFYNHLDIPTHISSTIAAMRQYGMSELGGLLHDAFQLFEGYAAPDPVTTWSEVLREYDPENRFDAIEKKINALDDYGLDNSLIE